MTLNHSLQRNFHVQLLDFQNDKLKNRIIIQSGAKHIGQGHERKSANHEQNPH